MHQKHEFDSGINRRDVFAEARLDWAEAAVAAREIFRDLFGSCRIHVNFKPAYIADPPLSILFLRVRGCG